MNGLLIVKRLRHLGRRSIGAFAIACVVLVGGLAAGDHAAAAAPARVQMFLPVSSTAWAFYLADKRGYFKTEGIDAQIRVFNSGAEALQAFQALGADLIEAGDLPTLVFLDKAEGTAVTIGQVVRIEKGIQLVAPSHIRGPANLKGKKIATNLGASTEFFLRRYLSENGLNGQVSIINLDPGSQVPALIRGDVDAIVTYPDIANRVMSGEKYRVVHEWGSSMMLTAAKKFLETQPKAMDGVLRALRRAAQDIKANPTDALAAVSGQHGLIDQQYKDFLAYNVDLLPQYSRATHGFLQTVSDMLVEQGRLKQAFDFCRLVEVAPLRKVSPDLADGAPTCSDHMRSCT